MLSHFHEVKQFKTTAIVSDIGLRFSTGDSRTTGASKLNKEMCMPYFTKYKMLFSPGMILYKTFLCLMVRMRITVTFM